MKLPALLLTAVCLSQLCSAQITKNKWLLGGQVSFEQSKSKTDHTQRRSTEFQLKPQVGYFVIDKLAGGIQLDYVRTKHKTDITIRLNNFGIGPFVRYYLLAPASKINIVTDARIAFYESGTNLSDQKGKYRAYSGSAGPVVFLNQSIGVELLLGYTGTNDDASTQNGFRTSLGLQVHWGRR